MRFLMTVRADENSKAGLPPDPKLMAKIGSLGAEMAKAGKLIAMGGLGWSTPSTRVTAQHGELSLTDGPFAETKELIAGFALFDFASKEEAVERAKRFMQAHIDVLGPSYRGVVEVHAVMGG
jgi:hypothetical protein